MQSVGNVTLLQSSVPCPTCRQGQCRRRSECRDLCTLMRTLDSERVVAALSARIPLEAARARSGSPEA